MKEVQPENIEVASKVNGMTMNHEAGIEPDKLQTTVSDHPLEGIVEEVIGWPEGYSERKNRSHWKFELAITEEI